MAPTNKVILASALALASTAAAIAPEHPRIYYPQRVKRANEDNAPERRQFGNQGFNLADFFGGNHNDLDPAQAPPSRFQQPDNQNQNSNSGGGIGGILGGLFGGDDEDSVTTIVISKTITVPPKGTGSQDPTNVAPTRKPASKPKPSAKTTPSEQSTPSRQPTDSGIVIGTSSVEQTVSSPVPSSTRRPGSLPSFLSSILDPGGDNTSTPISSPTPTASTSGSVIPTDTASSTPTASKSGGLSLPVSIFPPSSSSTPATSAPSSIVTSIPPGNNDTTSAVSSLPPTSVVPPTSSVISVSSLPTGGHSSSVIPDNSTSVVTPPPTSQSTVPTASISTPIGGANSTAVVPTSQVQPTSHTEVVVSSTPTSSAPATWIPTTMVMEPSSMSSFIAPSSGTTSETKSALPTDVPKNIVPPNAEDKPAPKGTVPIQIGFLFQLNYNFVSSNADAAAQIFNYLPPALAGVAGIGADKVPVTKLVPFDTRRDLGYITTLAKVNWPESQLDALKNALWEPSSALYNNEQDIVRSLTAIINPKIPLLATGDDSSGNLGGGVGGSGAGGSSSGGGDPFQSSGDDSSSDSSKHKATTIGIAVGSLGIGVMYGAAMFIVARRYKRKRSLRRAAADDAASAEMQYTDNGSPALMGGALVSAQNTSYGGVSSHSGPAISSQNSTGGRSNPSAARSAGISNPVATENSLGWS